MAVDLDPMPLILTAVFPSGTAKNKNMNATDKDL